MPDFNQLDPVLDAWAEREHIAGYSACIMGPEGEAYTRCGGVMNAGGRAPDPDTIYGVGSISKSLTALCCCILACEGRLELDAPVASLVPGFSLPGQPREAVTVRHLLCHTSGLPPMEALEWSSAMNTVGRPADEDILTLRRSAPNAVRTLDDVLCCIAGCPHPAICAPGEHMSYSNEGYAVLSYIADRAADMPLERFMAERVFRPLGMTRSLLDGGIDGARRLGNLTSLFAWKDGAHACCDGWTVLPPYRGCAMVKSTARDIAAYMRALSNRGRRGGVQAVPAAAVELMLGAGHPLSPSPVMCMGIYKRAFRGHVICDHGGALYGLSAKQALLLDEGYGFALLTNENDAGLDRAMWAMENAVLGLPAEESHEWFVPSGLPFSRPDMISGEYAAYEGLRSCLLVSGDAEKARLGGAPVRLVPCGGTRFLALREDGALASRLTFHIRSGRAWGVTVGSRIFLREMQAGPNV